MGSVGWGGGLESVEWELGLVVGSGEWRLGLGVATGVRGEEWEVGAGGWGWGVGAGKSYPHVG